MASQAKRRMTDDQNAFLELPHKLNGTGGSELRLDAYEVNGMIEMTAEVPGVPESDIEVSIDGDVLTIGVEKMNRSSGKRVHFSERAFGRFERSIQLPFAPDPDSVDAAAENGLLTIRFPRADAQRTRRRIALRGTPADAEAQGELGPERSAIGSEWDDMVSTERPVTVDVTATRLS